MRTRAGPILQSLYTFMSTLNVALLPIILTVAHWASATDLERNGREAEDTSASAFRTGEVASYRSKLAVPGSRSRERGSCPEKPA